MTDDWCICGKCGAEVESLFRFNLLKGKYELIKDTLWCAVCEEPRKSYQIYREYWE